jgi:hypothetical protein
VSGSHNGDGRRVGEEPVASRLDAPSGLSNGVTDAAQSPGLRADKGAGPAFELKFELRQDDVLRMKAWARRHLHPDPHGADGCYQVTSVYCDTAAFDVFHRSAGYRRSKLRLRRYGSAPFVFLERKLKRGDQVRKRRVEVAPEALLDLAAYAGGSTPPAGWSAGWFLEHALKKQVAPTCRVGYRRTAFYGVSGRQSVRLTIDENLIGVPTRGWEAQPLQEGLDLLPGGALLELFRGLLPDLPLQTARVSKYRRCVRLCGLAQERPAAAPKVLLDPQEP